MRLPFPDIADLPEPSERGRRQNRSWQSSTRRWHRRGMSSRSQVKMTAFSLKSMSTHMSISVSHPKRLRLSKMRCSLFFPPCNRIKEVIRRSGRRQRKTSESSTPRCWVHALEPWFEGERIVNLRLEAHNADLAVLRLTLCAQGNKAEYKERNDSAVREILAKLFEHIHQPLPGNFQLLPDFRIFDGKHLYLVKPMQHRFWLRAAALADANAIALDLQDYSGSPKRRSRA